MLYRFGRKKYFMKEHCRVETHWTNDYDVQLQIIIEILSLLSPDSALVSALSNEIQHEDGAGSAPTLPGELSEFKYTMQGASIVLSKQFQDEKIAVSWLQLKPPWPPYKLKSH